jgi:hypothetical protein
MQVRVRRLGRHRIAAIAIVAGLIVTGCSDIPDEPVRTGELAPTPTPLPTATPVAADAEES